MYDAISVVLCFGMPVAYLQARRRLNHSELQRYQRVRWVLQMMVSGVVGICEFGIFSPFCNDPDAMLCNGSLPTCSFWIAKVTHGFSVNNERFARILLDCILREIYQALRL